MTFPFIPGASLQGGRPSGDFYLGGVMNNVRQLSLVDVSGDATPSPLTADHVRTALLITCTRLCRVMVLWLAIYLGGVMNNVRQLSLADV